MRQISLVGFVLLALVVNVGALPRASSGSHRPAPAVHPPVTAEDLIPVVFPAWREGPADATTGYGPTAIPVRHLDTDEEPVVLEGVTEHGASVVQTVPDGPETRHVLYLEVFGELINDFTVHQGSGALVAVIDAGPTRKLLDLVEVKSDRDSDFMWGGPWSRLGSQGRAFIATSEHHNSSQYYHSYDVLTVHQGQVYTIARLALLSWGTEKEDVTETATFRVVPRPGCPYGDVVVSVTVDRRPYPGSTARPRVRRSVRTYRETYRWRGPNRGYEDAGGTLGFVVELNAAHY